MTLTQIDFLQIYFKRLLTNSNMLQLRSQPEELQVKPKILKAMFMSSGVSPYCIHQSARVAFNKEKLIKITHPREIRNNTQNNNLFKLLTWQSPITSSD